MNGPTSGKKYIDTIDVNSPEYMRDQYRPAEVKQDVRQMTERRRVNEILKSKQFRDELEEVVVEKIKCSTPDRASILALQQLSELILPQARLRHGPVYGRGSEPITPISNYKGDDFVQYDKGEKLLRCKLAACYRLIDQYHWSQPNHPTYISARVGHDQLTFLISPAGVPFANTSTTTLIKLNEEGQSISGHGGVDDIASVVHTATYLAKDEVKSVLLNRSFSTVLLSTLGSGLLPLSRDAMVLGRVPLIELRDNEDVATQLAIAFQSADKAILIKGIGSLVIGGSIEESFITARKLVGAIETQLKASPVGLENLSLPSEETQRKVFLSATKKQKRDELEFESLMRHLENAGHSTGYLFRESLFRKVERLDKVNAEVELPPTAVSVGYPDEDRPKDKKPAGFAEYLNTPYIYKREEVELASGSPYNKKITKWIQETSPAGNLIKIDNPNQFAPVGTDPRELKATVRKICREYYDENITAGPQSKILEGLTWEEAQRVKDKNKTSDTMIMVGAASRGIILKGHQNQGSLYRTYYAPNPFSNVTDDDVNAYKTEIGQKTAEDPSHIVEYNNEDSDHLVPGPDGHLISTEERLKQVKQQQQQQQLLEQQHATDSSVEATETDVEALKKRQQQQQEQFHQMNRGETHPTVISSLPSHIIKEQGKLPTSPAKSVSSGEGTAPETFSGTEEKSEFESSGATGTDKKKKKKGFRMPSFSKKKDKKEK